MAKDTNFYSLRVKDKVEEATGAITVYFDIPEELRQTFEFKAGQYLTLRMVVDGKEERRSYSLCTKPGNGVPGVTIKRVKKGSVSNFVHDEIEIGDTVDVMPPDGRFVITPDPERRKTYYFFGAGSGITPLMSQIRCLLDEEPMSTLHLLYGNRDIESIIFREDLDALQEKYAGQLTVEHTLSKPQKRGLLGLGKSKGKTWTGPTGRIDPSKVRAFLQANPDHHNNAGYYVCGPGDMIEMVRSTLTEMGVTKELIHAEYFTPADAEPSANGTSAAVSGAKLTAHLNGETIVIPIGEKTVLETLQDAGYDPPFSCTSGACATCMAKVLKGSVEMEMCFALNESEIEEGFVLTCQSHPTTPELELTYDV